MLANALVYKARWPLEEPCHCATENFVPPRRASCRLIATAGQVSEETMKLEKITISNFKGIREAVVEPSTFTCMVGANNAGKSSVLQAVVTLLNRPAQLPTAMFYDADAPVILRATFSGVTGDHLLRLADEHRDRIAALVRDERLTLIAKYRIEQRVEVTTLRSIPSDQRFDDDAVDELFRGKRGAAVRQALTERFPEYAELAPAQLNITEAKAFLRERASELPEDQLQTVERPLPSGAPASITALLPEPIYIPAVKNLSDDLKTTQSTSFGRLLGLLLDDMQPDIAEVSEALGRLNSMLNRVLEAGEHVDRRHHRVQALETMVEGLLRENFPRAPVQFEIPPPELRTILNSAQIYVDDGSKDLIENKGDGIKRSLTFALLQAYVQTLRDRAVAPEGPAIKPLLFLFEEPELYLHPKSQRTLFDTLSRISALHQVVVTTHSPIFFAPDVTASFIRVAKMDAEPKPIGRLYPVDFTRDAQRATSFRLAKFENLDAAFFSDRVVLIEGESDDFFCRHISKIFDTNWCFEKAGISIVRVSGKGNFSKFRDFFGAFGIETKIVADLDAVFDGYDHLGANAEAGQLRAAAIQQIDSRIAALGTAREPTTRQIQSRINQRTWKQRYEQAKLVLREMQRTKSVDDQGLAQLDELFTWEHDIARVRVCKEDNEAAAALLPLIDSLRQQGICVLTKGAIEDYYPRNTPADGPKPDRALAAINLVTNRNDAMGLSLPLGENRQPELFEVFSELFRAI